MKKFTLLLILICMVVLMNCGKSEHDQKPEVKETEEFKYFVERFADIKLGRFQIPGFDELTVKQKEMLYYLYQAALSGRDIIWDQNYKYNLKVRRTLEEIYKHYKGDRATADFEKFVVYTKRVWFSNGIHHHYSTDKILPEFTAEYFAELVKNCPEATFPLAEGEKLENFVASLTPIMFDPEKDAKRVCTDPTKDLVYASANNYYDGVSEKEVEAFYKAVIKKDDPTPVSYGLNSRLTKEDGKVVEKVWKVDGMYGEAIEKIVFWLKKASAVAENEVQKKALDLLIEYYETGDLKTFDEYSIAWTNDTESRIDVVNGFIETYGDPLSFRASFESVVSFRDEEATRRTKTISGNAQWFEENSPIADEHKRKEVKGVSAKVITVVALGGDCAPNPPLGINLPNANWIRKNHGSKSVSLGNITHAYEKVSEGSGFLEEFAYSEEEVKLSKDYGAVTGDLHTDMHEVIGHGSGQINPGVGTPKETLKSYSSVIEEARADLVALYYFMDPKLVELKLIPSLEAGKAEYSRAIRNGMIGQLTRVKLGDSIEQTHMRNRQMIAKWAMELGKDANVVEKKNRDDKTYFVVNDYQKLREIFAKMLKEIQRIKSEGDYNAAKKLVETYGVKIDYDLHKEILERYEKLNVAPYSGFVMPKLVAVEENGKITDVKVEYPMDFAKQMLDFAENYSFLPTVNN